MVDVTQKERSREFDMVRFKDRGGERRLPGWAPNATEVVIDRVRVGVRFYRNQALSTIPTNLKVGQVG